MRDDTILEGFNRMSDQIAADQSKLQSGYALLRTRVDAIENLMLGSRFGLIRMMILQLVSPRLLANMVRNAHADQIRKFNVARTAAMAEKPKIKTPPKPIITKVV